MVLKIGEQDTFEEQPPAESENDSGHKNRQLFMMTPKFNDKVSKQSTNEKELDSELKQSSRGARNSQIEGIPMRTSNLPLRSSNVKVGGMNGISIL